MTTKMALATRTMPTILALLATMAMAGGARAESAPLKATALELNVVWPFVPGVGLYQLRLTRHLWDAGSLRGDVVVSVMGRPPQDRPGEGEFAELGGGLGYRQYFAGGAHAELALYPTWARLTDNVVDGKTYDAFALTLEAYLGYRFVLSELGVEAAKGWAVEPVAILQVGLGSNVLNTNPWPTTEEDGDLFFVGTLLIGVAF